MRQFCISILSGIVSGITSGLVLAAFVFYIDHKYDDFKQHNEMLNTYLTAQWSTNAGDLLINGKDYQTERNQELVIMNISVDNYGLVTGSILSKGLCDKIPFFPEAIIYGEQTNFLDFLYYKKLYIRLLRDNALYKNPLLATFKIVSEDLKLGTLTVEVINNDYSELFPKKITFVRNPSNFNEDSKYLHDYCKKTSQEYFMNIIKGIKK